MRGDLERAVAEWKGDPVVGAYLWWWSKGEAGHEPGDRWDGMLAGRTVELRGPADAVPVQTDLVARVLRGPEADPSCDVAYCNHEYWDRVDKSRVRLAIVSKGSESVGMAKGRTLWDSRVLFEPGHLNVVPAAMLDLLTGHAHVTITGATFYAVGRDYADEDRANPLASIMHHNPIVNRRIVKNLFDAGVVDAAGAAADVLAWDDAEYLAAFTDHRR
jgi:hypothetical protein